MQRLERKRLIRYVRWAAALALLQSGSLAALAWMLPGFTVGDPQSVVIAAVSITAALALGWPMFYRLAALLHPLLFPLLSFALSGSMVMLISTAVDSIGFRGLAVAGLGTGMLVAAGMTALNVLLGGLFSLGDIDAYDWFVTRPLRRRYADAEQTETPGVLFLEIDGLSEPVLRKALAEGWMPTLQRWIDRGSHELTVWEPDLSSQTSASQAGILLGDNSDIPAFRWYEKDSHTLMVSSRFATARELERRLNHGSGLLENGGASRWNVFSGGALDCVCTYSTLGDRTRSGSGHYLAYFANPYTLPRSLMLYVSDIFRERWQAWRQARENIQPRIRRTLKYALVRAAATTVMLEASLFMLISDMFRGVPAVYTTLFAYDEVAHHSGIDRRDAMKVLEKLDRMFGTLERASRQAPRPYRFVVLSDHGQSMGPTFRQVHGETLGQLVTRLVGPDAITTIDHRETEDWGHLNLALSQAIEAGANSRAATMLQRALRRSISDNQIALGQSAGDIEIGRAADVSDVVVLASGNLGLISFPGVPGRMTHEEILEQFPTLIPGLIAHDGIGLIMVRSATDGGLAIGGGGIHYLDRGDVVGVDPLAPYGPNAARHLRRTDGFSNVPDVIVMSSVDAASGAVFAFEELVGSHGGLGGSQTQPVLLHPVEFEPGDEPIVGAAALHCVLKRWIASSHQ
jgi:uncharacterized membrane protein YvlD (DUF360 family)